MVLLVSPALIFLQLLSAIFVICEVYCIKPTIEYQCSVHDQPCLMLDDFIANTSRNLNANASLELKLLPGNHSLSRDLQIWSIKKFQISSQINSSWIVCHEPNKEFQFFNVTTLFLVSKINYFCVQRGDFGLKHVC